MKLTGSKARSRRGLTREWRWFVLCVVVSTVVVGCSGGDDYAQGIRPGSADLGVEVGQDVVDTAGRPADPGCRDMSTGVACPLPNATGTCSSGRCVFLACERGYRDCDERDENGCETDVTEDSHCGGCGVACGDSATCQESAVGFVCATTPACSPGRIDLDSSLENGCEFEVVDLGPESLTPGNLEVSASLVEGGRIHYAGSVDNSAFVTTFESGAQPQASLTAAVEGSIVDLEALPGQDRLVAAWSRGAFLSSLPASSAEDPSVELTCLGDGATPQIIGLSRRDSSSVFVLSDHGLFALDASCGTAGQCLGRTFDRVDYLTAYFPRDPGSASPLGASAEDQLSLEEFAGCDLCFLEPSAGTLAVSRSCIQDSVCVLVDEQPDCQGCGGRLDQCPTFMPLAASLSPAGLVVATARGVVALHREGDEWRAGARAEDFNPEAGFVSADIAWIGDQRGAVWLLSDRGTLNVVDIAQRAGQSVPLSFSITRPAFAMPERFSTGSAKIIAAGGAHALVRSGRDVVLVRSTSRGSTFEVVDPPDTGIDEPEVVTAGYDASEESFAVLYSALGRLFVRKLSYRPRQEAPR